MAIVVIACFAVSGVGYAVENSTLHQAVSVSAGSVDVSFRASSPTIATTTESPWDTCSATLGPGVTGYGGFYYSVNLRFSAGNFSPDDNCGYNGFNTGVGLGYSGDTRVLAIVDLGSVQATLTSALSDCVVNGVSEAVQDFSGEPIQCGDFVFIDAVMLDSPVVVGPTTPFGYGALVAGLGALGAAVSPEFPGEQVTFLVTITAEPVLA